MQIYKSNAAKNHFVQMFLSENNLIVAVTLALCMPMYIYSSIAIVAKVGVTVAVGMVTGFITYQKMDGKPLLTKLLPFLVFIQSKKNYTPADIISMSDYFYTIKDDVVFTQDKALTVIKLLPPDVSILNESEKEGFKKQLNTYLHSLGPNDAIQIIVDNRRATVSDYQAHIDDLNNQNITTEASQQVMEISKNYIRDFQNLIKKNKKTSYRLGGVTF